MITLSCKLAKVLEADDDELLILAEEDPREPQESG